ncbi:DMT family transporter [Photobacterium sp. 2_MG-2023]|uniref:DMT family transporter n=1 Tax=Photobacterium sp. 2_MG-2023 TaxID=3062663 RepID=UPI0026E1EB80|nr:DMT family transporter [Photobacterium sp. 2_MG-2023]MDO6582641.1 DMT family transporter [Photobacterium sp. 2_MG-2023]
MNNGVLLTIGSAFIFSIMNALVKAASDTIPTAEIVFFRSIIGTVLILLLMKHSRIRFSSKGIPLLVLRGVFGALYLLAFVYTLANIPMADAVILAYLSPFFVIVFSRLILKDKLPPRSALLLLAVLTGAGLIINPLDYESYNLFALAGVASAAFAAGASITIKQLSQRHHTYEIVFYFLFVATLISAILMADNFVMPQGIAWLYLIAIGVVSLLGQIFLTQAFSHENAAVVAVTRYIGIVFNILWGLMFWQEIPDSLTIAGGVIIVIASILLSNRKPVAEKADIDEVKGSQQEKATVR